MEFTPTDRRAAEIHFAKARESLDSACEELDNAVRALPEVGEDRVLASPELLALLLRVVVARRKFAEFESSV
jgi:hypothetical protein